MGNRLTPGILFLALLSAAAQPAPPPVLSSSGGPIQVPFQCSEGDMEWGALACTAEAPCATYLEITSVGQVGDALVAVGNIHTESLTLYSILLVSMDAGATWREPVERLRGVSLDRVASLNETGWVSGQTVSPLPGAPFFLITTDGGTTWRNQPVFTEPKRGQVIGFIFDDPRNGRLFLDAGLGGEGDRYEIYRTADGGLTWAILQTTARRPEIPPSPPSDWRVAVNAAQKSYQLERRAGGRWVPVAAFAVGLSPCRPLAH